MTASATTRTYIPSRPKPPIPKLPVIFNGAAFDRIHDGEYTIAAKPTGPDSYRGTLRVVGRVPWPGGNRYTLANRLMGRGPLAFGLLDFAQAEVTHARVSAPPGELNPEWFDVELTVEFDV